MKFLANNIQIQTFIKGGALISFDCSEITKAQLKNITLNDCTIELKEFKKKRSLNQNSMLWELIGEISVKENGNKVDTEDIYLQLIEQTGASVEFFLAIPEAEQTLRRLFRIVKVVDERIQNGKKLYVFKCWLGSSQFDTKEMSQLIDKTLERAEQDGIETEYWKEILFEERNEIK